MLRNDFATNIRGWIRFVPTQSILASVSEGANQIARGIVSNISESGARLVTNVRVASGKTVDLKLRFRQDSHLETQAKVVWGTESIERSIEVVGALHGVEFLHPELNQRRDLRRMLVPPDFRDVWTPKTWSPEDSPISGALIDPDIERLIANIEPVVEDEFSQIQKELLRDFDMLFERLKGH